jgi:hypothetical protein
VVGIYIKLCAQVAHALRDKIVQNYGLR